MDRNILPTRYEMEKKIDMLTDKCLFYETLMNQYKNMVIEMANTRLPAPIILSKCPKCGWEFKGGG